MTVRFSFLFLAASLLALGALAYACGNGESDEDAIRDTVQEAFTRCNEGDRAGLRELTTDLDLGCPPNPPSEVEIRSVTVEGDEAFASSVRTDSNGDVYDETIGLRKEGDSWLIHTVGGQPR